MSLIWIIVFAVSFSVVNTNGLVQAASKEFEVELEFEDENNSEDPGIEIEDNQDDSDTITVLERDDSGQEAGDDTLQDAAVEDDTKSVQYHLLDDSKTDLFSISERDGIYGDELKKIAISLTENEDKIQEVKLKIEKRNKLMNFMFGIDLKDLSVINEVLKRNSGNINKLEEIAKKVDNNEIRDLIIVQVKQFKERESAVQNFVAEKGNSFSLFGWAVKLFN